MSKSTFWKYCLLSNPGLAHIAEHIVSFLDDKSMAQCRLVSKNYNVFLLDIWQNMTLKEAHRLCETKLKISDDGTIDGKLSETTIFEEWPDWKEVLKEVTKLEDLSAVTWLLKEYFRYIWHYDTKEKGMCYSLQWDCNASPLHFIAENYSRFDYCNMYEDEDIIRVLKVLLETSLDFNVEDGDWNTPLHKACEHGSKKVVEFLLNNAVKKGIDYNAVNINDQTIVHLAYWNHTGKGFMDFVDRKPVLKHLFKRRNEFNFDISPVDDEGRNILHLTCGGEDYFVLDMMLQWAEEVGINVSDVDHYGNTILHETVSEYFPTVAFGLLGREEHNGKCKGLDKNVLSLMANMTNSQNKRPIDLAKESREQHRSEYENDPHDYTDFHTKLITELEKYTSNTD